MGLTKTQVSQLYVVLLGRASEGGGNRYWQADTSGTDLAAAADTMFAVGAVQSYFGSSLDTSRAFIEKIYADTLGRTYDQDPEGIDYWINELDNGRTRGQVAASLITAVQEAVNAGAGQDRFNNRVMVSDYTADHIEEFSASIGFSDFISQVTDDTATVSQAMADVDMAADLQNTQSLTLTSGADTLTGSDGDDRIVGSDETYGANDAIDGGSGEDSLTLFLLAGVTDPVDVSGVERIIIRNGYAGTDLDGSGWEGVDLLLFSGCTAVTRVDQVQAYLNLGVKNNGQGIVLTYGDDALASAAATQTISVRDSTGSLAVRTGGTDRITRLDIETAGTSRLAIEENDITEITITGWGRLELLSAADGGTLVQVSAVEASSAAADLILDMSGVDMSVQPGDLVTVTGGAGDDIITTSAYDNLIFGNTGDDIIIVASGLDDDDLLLGGSGYDTLSLTWADALAAASDANILNSLQGFEVIGFRDALDMGQALDLSVFGVNAAVIQAGLSGDETLEGFGADAVVEIQTDASETDVLTITMDGASEAGSSDDQLYIRFNADLEAGDGVYESVFDVKGINIISVTTADASIDGETVAAGTLPGSDEGYRLTLVSDQNVTTLKVSGDQSFYHTAGATSGIEALEAGNMTGDITLDFNTAFGGTRGGDHHYRAGPRHPDRIGLRGCDPGRGRRRYHLYHHRFRPDSGGGRSRYLCGGQR